MIFRLKYFTAENQKEFLINLFLFYMIRKIRLKELREWKSLLNGMTVKMK